MSGQSERQPPSRDGGTPAERLLALVRGRARDRRDLADLLGLTPRQVANVLAQLGDDVVSDDGWVRLKPLPAERQPRRARSADHLRQVGERRATDADEQPDVAAVRERLLGGDVLLTVESVATWLEQKAQSGEPTESDTPLGYLDPSDPVARWVPSTSELEPLRRASERLACRYGWAPAQATVFVLTGVVPLTGVRVTTRYTLPDPGAPTRWTVDFDANEDAEVVADAIRRAQREHDIPRKPKSADAERLARLASFVAEHGPGVSAYERWNREQTNPDDRYGDRRSFQRAAKRATG
jgi:hypothetical protein